MADLCNALNEHMDGTGNGARRADALWRCQHDLQEFSAECERACLQFVNAREDFVGEARAAHFMGVLAQRASASAQPQRAISVIEGLLPEVLIWATMLEEPALRTRAMLLTKELLHGAGSTLSSATMEELLEPLVGALNDKVAKIRKLAVVALSKVAQSEGFSSQVVDAYIQQLELESNQTVRVAVAQSMPPRAEAVDAMMERTRDVSPEVRAAVYAWFGGAPAAVLSTQQRVTLLASGLRDRVPAAKDAATAMAASWLQQHCGGDVLQLLATIDVQQEQGVALELLDALSDVQALDCVQLLHSGTLGSLGSAAANAEAAAHADTAVMEASGDLPMAFEPTPPEQAFAWTFVARHLHATASAKSQAAAKTTGAAAAAHAAAASDCHNLLEAFLPDSAGQLACLVRAHACAGEEHTFAVCQMLGIAGFAMDWTDGTSRSMATDLVKGLMEADLREGARPEGASQPRAWGGAADEWEWQRAVVSFAGRVLPDALELLRATLPTLCAFAEGQGGAGSLRCLAYASQLLRCFPRVSLTQSCGGIEGDGRWHPEGEQHSCVASLQRLLDQVLLPCTRHADACVRQLAMGCVGMYPLLPWGKGTLQVAVATAIRLLDDSAPAVKQEAARVLLNLLLVFGVAAVNEKTCTSGLQAMQAGMSDLASQFARTDIHTQSASAPSSAGHSPGLSAQQPPNFDCLQILHRTLAKAKKLRRAEQQQHKSRKKVTADTTPEAQDGLICAIVDGMARLALFQELHQVLQARQQGSHHSSGSSSGNVAQEQDGSGIPAAGMAITDEDARQILDQLLRLFRDPAFEDIAHIQQILGTFFEAYCKRAAGNKRRLAQTLPNTFRRALAIPLKGRKTAAPGLVKFATELLQLPLGQQQQEQGDSQRPEPDQGTEQLCQDVLQVLHGMPDNPSTAEKEYFRELGAMLCHLPFNAAQHSGQLQCCLVLLRRCTSGNHLSTSDRTLMKHLGAAKARFEAMEAQALGPDTPRLSDGEMQALLEHAQLVVQLRQAAQQELAAEDDEDGTQGAGDDESGGSDDQQTSSRARKARVPKRAPAARGKKTTTSSARTDQTAASDDGREDMADTSAAGSRDQRRPARPVRGAAAKARQQLAATVEEEA
ncbi:nuclear condensing complex subunit [Dunaliella salina]|uniref:Nuclear condensing complex subunit n=1 Tax=Dunaliella salina TaxID=3046 RepID=A0ABQ7GT58_DUNSA|nr:nuclear condensing complex subunit [Dunaliella salina]|eukprot:KAF5837785.1 nuclear condensing complex subunit [Dunaliella salina]